MSQRAVHASSAPSTTTEAPSPPVRTERDGAVWIVTIDRPARRNAVDAATAAALAAAFRAYEADDTLAVAVLCGAGGHFCAGADLQALAAGEGSNRVAPEGDGPMGPTRMVLDKPVIAAVAGYAVAGGLELALWCDLRIAEESAIFGVFCRRWGVPLIDGGTVRLPRLIGAARALDLILTGRAVDAREALAIGLCTRLVPDGEARAAAVALAKELAAFPQEALRGDRRSVLRGGGASEAEAMQIELACGMEALAASAQAGARRFAAGAGRHGGPDISAPHGAHAEQPGEAT